MPKRLPLAEFVALTGVIFATVAFSTDAMLPALGAIADDLSPEAPNRAQLMVTSFVLGMGVGTLFAGPLADTFGRKAAIIGGAVLYSLAALAAAFAQSLELVLAARVVQGLGAAGPRVAMLAMVRDLYSGRQMARVMSFTMLVFTLIPAAAPLIGAGIMHLTGWRGIFGAFVVFAVLTSAWIGLRQAETLAPEHRRPFRAGTIAVGVAEIVANGRVMLVIAALACVFGMLFTTLSSTQPVFDRSFRRAGGFPVWFAVIALISALGSLLNARIVVRLGMRRVIAATLSVEIAVTAAMAAVSWSGIAPQAIEFAAYVIWITSLFLMAGLTIGNLNALGMEPLGHLAGIGASVIGAAATIGAVLLAVPVGLMFDGTPLPLAVGLLAMAVLARLLVWRIEDVLPEDQADPVPR